MSDDNKPDSMWSFAASALKWFDNPWKVIAIATLVVFYVAVTQINTVMYWIVPANQYEIADDVIENSGPMVFAMNPDIRVVAVYQFNLQQNRRKFYWGQDHEGKTVLAEPSVMPIILSAKNAPIGLANLMLGNINCQVVVDDMNAERPSPTDVVFLAHKYDFHSYCSAGLRAGGGLYGALFIGMRGALPVEIEATAAALRSFAESMVRPARFTPPAQTNNIMPRGILVPSTSPDDVPIRPIPTPSSPMTTPQSPVH